MVPANGSDQPAEDAGRAPNSDRFFQFLTATLPDLYDFAARLLRSSAAAEQAIETGLRVILRMPSGSLASEETFRTRTFSETYLVAEASPVLANGVSDGLVNTVPASEYQLDAASAAIVWQVACSLPLQEYAALHLHSRLGLNREAMADSLGVTPAYAFVLLGRAERHFVDGVQASLLLRADDRCSVVTAMTENPIGGDALNASERMIAEHLAAGCDSCKRVLAPFGEIASLLGLLASVAPPASLQSRLAERLRERAESLDERTKPAPVVAVSPFGVSTAPSPLVAARPQRRWGLGRRGAIPALMIGEAIVLLGIVAVAGIASGRLNRPEPEVRVLNVAPPSSSEVRQEDSQAQDQAQSEVAAQTEISASEVAAATEEAPVAPPTATVVVVPATTTTPATVVPAAPTEPPGTPAPSPTPFPPRLVAINQAIRFAPGESVKTVELRNAGTGQITWDVRPQQSWILASPSGGTFADAASVQIRIDRSIIGRGARQGAVTINSNAGTVVIAVAAE